MNESIVLSSPPAGMLRRAPLLRAALAGAVLLTALAGAALPAASAFADDVDSLSITPAGENGARDDRSRLDYQVAPGQHLDDRIQITNTGTTHQDVVVYAADAFNTSSGDLSLVDAGAESTDSGAWVTFDGQKRITVPLDAGASAVVPFALDVPADAGPGDHTAGIVASAQSVSDQILVDRRVATRLYVRVPGDLQPALSITGVTATYDGFWNPFDGSETITYTVENTGNVALGAATLVGTRTWFGIGVGSVDSGTMDELLPGNRREVTTTLTGLAQLGFLNPYVEMRPETVGDNALQIPVPSVVARDAFIPAVPWWLLVLLVVGGVGYLILRISGASNEKRAAAWLAYTEEQARERAREDLVSSGASAASDAPRPNDPRGGAHG